MAERSHDPLRAALTWLATDHEGNSESELAELHQHVNALADASLSTMQRLDVLDLLCQRAMEVSGRFRPELLVSKLPCPRTRYEQTSTLIDILFSLAESARVLVTERHWWRKAKSANQTRPIELGLDVLGEACLLSALVGSTTPFGLWQRAHELWLAANQYEKLKDSGGTELQASNVGLRYQRLLLLAISQTESLTAREQQWLFDYLESVADEFALSLEPSQPVHAAYWFDPSFDTGPLACALRMPEEGRQVVYFSPAGLARRLSTQILWLEECLLDSSNALGESNDSELLDTESAGLPVGLTPIEVLSLLRRLKTRWTVAPKRVESRNRQHYTVEVKAGMKAVWASGRNDQSTAEHWTVYNESPGGYAILCVGGIRQPLSPGMVLALRREPNQGWLLCIARWIRADSPDQIELGLQVIAKSFDSASICFSGSDTMVPALILHAEPLVRQNLALLTPCGTYVSNHFILVRDDERLYVAHGRALGLEMQTPSVELFQYEIDHFPKIRRAG
jgi:hypothetical protein